MEKKTAVSLKRNRMPLAAGAPGPKGDKGDKGDTGGSDRLAVFDDNGLRLGPVVGIFTEEPPIVDRPFNGGVWFSMTVNGTTVLLAVDENSAIYGTGQDELSFASIDCTGTPLFRTDFLESNFLPSTNAVVGVQIRVKPVVEAIILSMSLPLMTRLYLLLLWHVLMQVLKMKDVVILFQVHPLKWSTQYS